MSLEEGLTAVLVDPHPLWVEAMKSILSRMGINTVGFTVSSEVGLRLVNELEPDLLVTSIGMPEGEMDGISLIREAREQFPTLKAVVVSSYDDDQHIEAAFGAGAGAYVLKTATTDDVIAAIRQTFSYSIYLARVPHAEPVTVPRARENASGLTPRELEILRLVAEGMSNAELARLLWVTEQTIKFHLSNIYRKLGVSNRTEAGRWAQLNGLLVMPEEQDLADPGVSVA